MTLGARRSRLLGAIWILAGLGLTAAAVLLWLDRQTVSVWELPMAVLAFWVGAWLWSQRVTIDRHGITLSSLTRTERTLWAGIDSVEVQATWWRPALTINRKGDGSVTSVRTTSGLTSSQRSELFDVLHELAREHGFAIRRKGFGELASATDHLDVVAAGAPSIGLFTVPDGADTPGEAASADEDEDDSTDADATIALDPVVLDAMDERGGNGAAPATPDGASSSEDGEAGPDRSVDPDAGADVARHPDGGDDPSDDSEADPDAGVDENADPNGITHEGGTRDGGTSEPSASTSDAARVAADADATDEVEVVVEIERRPDDGGSVQ
jgi:hypothetical protein